MFVGRKENDAEPEQGCGKWLSTKTTRRIAQSIKNSNGYKLKHRRKRPALTTTRDLAASVISLSDNENLSRTKQSKMEQFFKPIHSSIRKNNPGFLLDLNEKADNSKTLTLVRQHQKLQICDQHVQGTLM